MWSLALTYEQQKDWTQALETDERLGASLSPRSRVSRQN
jgi:hypothetical protein